MLAKSGKAWFDKEYMGTQYHSVTQRSDHCIGIGIGIHFKTKALSYSRFLPLIQIIVRF